MLKFAFLGILAACAYILVPPAAFPDRQKVDPTKTTLDNEYYDFLGKYALLTTLRHEYATDCSRVACGTIQRARLAGCIP